MKNKKFKLPFRVSVLREDSEHLFSCHSYKTFKLAIKKYCELIPLYFDVQHPKSNYSIIITKFTFNKKKQVIRKRLLTTKRQIETK